MNELEDLRQFIETRCVERREAHDMLPGKIPGHWYNWLLCLRRCLYDPKALRAVVNILAPMIVKDLEGREIQLCGLESGAVPIVTALMMGMEAQGLNVPVFTVRKHRKEYGLLNWHEGIIDPGREVVLVDELCHSGWSLKLCYEFCIRQKLKVAEHAYAIIAKVDAGAVNASSDPFIPRSITVHSIFNLTDINLTLSGKPIETKADV
jgi:orotate phosphoribosyltransferase